MVKYLLTRSYLERLTCNSIGENLLPKWHKLGLHPKILKALHETGFLQPTPIQEAALPVSLTGRDIVGVAQTVRGGPFELLFSSFLQGSGKTLAYGLPILNYLLGCPRPSSNSKRSLRAMILAPTRELALQVSSHLNAIVCSIEHKEVELNASRPKNIQPRVSIASIVGGMSSQKQKRLLDRGIDILVGTPGRLWDIIQDVSLDLSFYI